MIGCGYAELACPFTLLTISFFLGGFGSNGASAQSFQSDGDPTNTTVSRNFTYMGFRVVYNCIILFRDLFAAVGFCWRAWPKCQWRWFEPSLFSIWWSCFCQNSSWEALWFCAICPQVILLTFASGYCDGISLSWCIFFKAPIVYTSYIWLLFTETMLKKHCNS